MGEDIVTVRDFLQAVFDYGIGLNRRDRAREALAAFERIVADRRALAQGNAWRPIETAPKDGTRVMLWAAEWEGANSGCMFGTGWGQYDHIWKHQPTHWQPLPAAPDEIARAQTQGEG